MSGPFIYIGTYTVQEGKQEVARAALHELVETIEANEPRLIAFNVYFDEEGSKVSVVQVHPDADSMEFHMKVVAEHITGAFDYLGSTVSEQVYGTPAEGMVKTFRELSEPGTPLIVMPVHESGFTRASAN